MWHLAVLSLETPNYCGYSYLERVWKRTLVACFKLISQNLSDRWRWVNHTLYSCLETCNRDSWIGRRTASRPILALVSLSSEEILFKKRFLQPVLIPSLNIKKGEYEVSCHFLCNKVRQGDMHCRRQMLPLLPTWQPYMKMHVLHSWCTVRSFNFSHAAGLGTPYVR